VDGTLLRQLPQVTQACFASRKDRGWKLHTHFEVLRGVATFGRVTDGSGLGPASEKAVLKDSLQADRCYITDRGYEEFALFNAIVAVGSSYDCRVRNDHHFTASEAREVTPEARAAGVLADAVGRMGSPKSQRIEHPHHDQRQVTVRVAPHPKRGGRRRRGVSQDIVLVTNLVDVPAEVIALLYRFRWLIELFFRWLKCGLVLPSSNQRKRERHSNPAVLRPDRLPADPIIGRPEHAAQSVDLQAVVETQRVAFRIGDADKIVVETGLYNLTQDEAPIMVHFATHHECLMHAPTARSFQRARVELGGGEM
jgi:hypothetical protein